MQQMLSPAEQVEKVLKDHGINVVLVTEPEEKHNQKIICRAFPSEPMRSLRERIAIVLFTNGYYNFSIKSTYLYGKTDDNIPVAKKATCEIVFWSKTIKKESKCKTNLRIR